MTWRFPPVTVGGKYTPLPVEGLRCSYPWPVYRRRLAYFVSTEVGRAAGEIVIHVGQPHPCIHGLAAGFEPEIEVCRMIDGVRRLWVRRAHVLEDVVVQLDTVGLLAGCGSQ